MKEILDRFQGIDRGKTVWLRVGPHMVYGSFEEGHSKEEKISAVHFVRFRSAWRSRERHLEKLPAMTTAGWRDRIVS